jgi:glyoxylate reductase
VTNSRPRIFVTRELPSEEGMARLRAAADVTVWPEYDPPPRDALIKGASASDGLLCLITDRVDAELLDASPDLKCVANLAVGYDNIDVAACTERGVLVCNTPGVLTETTAELTMALLLSYTRRTVEGDAVVRDGRWTVWHPSFMLGLDLHGATLGIVGLGAIGLAVAQRARAFDMRVVYTSRSRKPDAERDLGVEYLSLDDLLRQSDFVSLTVALTDETRKLIGARELSLMKPSAVLINTARGGVVDQAALVDALHSKTIAGAALDVFEVEPIPTDDPLLALDNVIVVPHLGSATVGTRKAMSDLAIDNLLAYFRGERPQACVNPIALT